ncbi:hypothetical protein [Catalinimonas alkaloidigena]|uniref:hypothetical protein n=1 Tax=Catalinimonas alkaloidigena TaxID=1075417 RepID=UPI002405F846|nr:hypothetical protein [Catalinimonas alkaloidigena]
MITAKDSLPTDAPFILICDADNPYKTALFLTAHANKPLRFIKAVHRPLSYFKLLAFNILHIEPLLKISKHPKAKAYSHTYWKGARELIIQNQVPVFFTSQKHETIYVDKSVAKLALQTSSVFDFTLSLKIIPVKVYSRSDGFLSIKFLKGISIAAYEKEYKQCPARAINEITGKLQEAFTLSAYADDNKSPDLTAELVS